MTALGWALGGTIVLGVGMVWVLIVLRVHRQRWKLVAQGCPDFLWHFHRKTRKFVASDRIWDWSDRVPGGSQELFRRWRDLVRAEDQDQWSRPIRDFVEGRTPVLDLEGRITFPGREERWFRIRAHRGQGRRGHEIGGSVSDVTAIKALGERLWERSNIDGLTGLVNRHRVAEVLGTLRLPYCLLLVDVDRFSWINSSFRDGGGDHVLVWLARRLESLFRSEDIVARWGGDEFVIVVHGTLGLAELLARRIHETLDDSVSPPPVPTKLSVSIGIAQGPGPDDTTLVQDQAKQALRHAQGLGGGHTTVFTEALGVQASRRALLEAKLTQAIADHGLTLVFQPQYRLSDGALMGFEALARWTDPDLGAVSPAEFIPIAEARGLIRPLGAWALAEASRFVARQGPDHRPGLTVAVNVSVLQLRDPGYVDQAVRIVREAGAHPSSIELEITETVLVQGVEDIIAKLSQLRAWGFRIALDDFGQGYSSLSYLKVLPLDTLKIDKAFVDDGTPESLLGAMIHLGRDLNLRVVAEGVETAEQVATLVGHGCHHVQGFLYSRPLDAAQALALHRNPTHHS